jgi:cob(I)alamin adenosyltransferase
MDGIRIESIRIKVFKLAILTKGLVQVYTGNGKGKTTAAFGLAWRMLGRGGKVYICQFLKPSGRITGESMFARQFESQLTFEQVEQDWNLYNSERDPQQKERMQTAIVEKLEQIAQIAREGNYDLMILDELVVCLEKHLAQWEDVKRVLNERAEHVELVLTGRGADEDLIESADLVTRMEEIKHPYQQGITARQGIEN